MTFTKVSSRLIEDTLRYVLGAIGTDHYTFTGKGLTGTVNDPTLTLSRGHTYVFENRNSSGAHPFYIKTSIANGGTNDAYNTGVTNNGGAGGTEIVFTVPHDAPDTLYYQCSSHSSMAGELKIAGAVADGSITTAKLADQAVDLSKLPHGDTNNDGKFLRANNGADPTFETVNTDLVSDTSPQLGGNLATNTNDILFADNDSAKFGAGTDLEIFHDPTSSDSNIKHQNENGHLRILSGVNGNGGIKLMNRINNESYIECDSDAGVEIYHDNSKKIETTSYGSKTTGYHLQSALPSACVYGSAGWTVVNAGSATHPLAMFPNSAHNVGSMYNNGTGKMTAPVAGVYKISINLFCQGVAPQTDSTNNSFEIYLKKNGSTLSRHHNKIGYGNLGDNQQLMSLNCIEQLSANDEITIYVGAAGGGNWQMYGSHSNFQMVLLG